MLHLKIYWPEQSQLRPSKVPLSPVEQGFIPNTIQFESKYCYYISTHDTQQKDRLCRPQYGSYLLLRYPSPKYNSHPAAEQLILIQSRNNHKLNIAKVSFQTQKFLILLSQNKYLIKEGWEFLFIILWHAALEGRKCVNGSSVIFIFYSFLPQLSKPSGGSRISIIPKTY